MTRHGRSRLAVLFAQSVLAGCLHAELPAPEPPPPVLTEEPIAPPPAPMEEVAPAPAGNSAVAAPAALSLLDAPSEGAPAPSSGAELLAACAARMPRERVLLGGHLNMRKRYGVSLREFDFRAEADFGAAPPAFVYRVAGEDGAEALRVRAVRDPEKGLLLERLDGGGPAPSPSDPVLGTDVTWLDVGLDFIWWRNPVLAGTDRLKGRTCDLLEVEPPSPLPGCAKARLWIDRDQKVVLQAAQLDADGRVVRRLWVRAVQKSGGRWVFKDLEVESGSGAHRTRLHFDDVSFPDAPAP